MGAKIFFSSLEVFEFENFLLVSYSLNAKKLKIGPPQAKYLENQTVAGGKF